MEKKYKKKKRLINSVGSTNQIAKSLFAHSRYFYAQRKTFSLTIIRFLTTLGILHLHGLGLIAFYISPTIPFETQTQTQTQTHTQTLSLSLLISFVSHVSYATIQAKPRRKRWRKR